MSHPATSFAVLLAIAKQIPWSGRWIADCNRDLPNAQTFRIGQTHMNKMGRIDPSHREIRFGIIPDELCRIIAAVRKINDNSGSAVDDMAVRQNKAVRRNHKSRAASTDLALVAFASLLDLDVRDRGRDSIDCTHDRPRILVEQ